MDIKVEFKTYGEVVKLADGRWLCLNNQLNIKSYTTGGTEDEAKESLWHRTKDWINEAINDEGIFKTLRNLGFETYSLRDSTEEKTPIGAFPIKVTTTLKKKN